MKKHLLLLLLFNLTLVGVEAQTFKDAFKIGGNTNDYLQDLVYDSDGNKIVAGMFEGSITLGSTTLASRGGFDHIIAKFDTNDDLLWVRHISSTNSMSLVKLAVDNNDNIVVAANYQGNCLVHDPSGNISATSSFNDVVVVHLQANGSLISTFNIGFNINTVVRGVAVATNNKVYLTGQLDYGNNDNDIYIIRMPMNGYTAWVETFGGSGNDVVNSISMGYNNAVYLAGAFSGTIEFGDLSNITVTADGLIDAFLISISDNQTANSIIRIDNSNSNGLGSFYDIHHDGNNIHLSGVYTGGISFGNQTLTNNASHVKSFYASLIFNPSTGAYTVDNAQTIESNANAFASRIRTNSKGEVYISGYYTGRISYDNTNITSNGGTDGFVGKVGSNGELEYMLTAGNINDDRVNSLAIYGDKVTLGGYFRGSLTLGKETLQSSNGSIDWFLTDLHDYSPEIAWVNVPQGACQEAVVDMEVEGSELNTNNGFSIEISDASGSFNNPTVVGLLNSQTGGIVKADLKGLASGTAYKLRLKATTDNLELIYPGTFEIWALPETPKIIGPTKVDEFAESKYSVAFVNGISYNWTVDNGNQIDGGSSNLITVQWGSNGFGNLKAIATSDKGCVSEEGTLSVAIGTTIGIEQAANNGMSLYPTNVTNTVILQLNRSNTSKVNYTIFGANGKQVVPTTEVANAQGTSEISVTNLPAGVYWVKVICDGQPTSLRFIKS